MPEEETRDSWTSQRGAVGGPASFDTGRYFDRQRREYDEAPRRARRVDIDAPVQATERMERYGRERDEFSYLGDEEPYSVPSRSGAIVPRGRRDGYGDLTERDYGAWEGAPAAGGIAPMLDATINVVKSIWRATLGVLEANGLIEPRDVYSTPMLPGASSDPSRASRSLRAPQEWDVDRRSDLRSASGRSEETWGPGRDTGSPPATVRGFLAPPRDEIDSWDMPVERTRVRRGTTAPSPEWDGWLEEGGLGEDFPPKRRSPASSPGRARLGAADRENADSAVPFRVRGDGEDALAGSPDRMRRGTRASGREIGTELRPGAAKQGDASSRRMKAAANTTGAAAGKSGVRRRLRMEGDVGRMRDESARADAPDEEEVMPGVEVVFTPVGDAAGRQ